MTKASLNSTAFAAVYSAQLVHLSRNWDAVATRAEWTSAARAATASQVR